MVSAPRLYFFNCVETEFSQRFIVWKIYKSVIIEFTVIKMDVKFDSDWVYNEI